MEKEVKNKPYINLFPDKGYEIVAKEGAKEVEYFVVSKETGEEYPLPDYTSYEELKEFYEETGLSVVYEVYNEEFKYRFDRFGSYGDVDYPVYFKPTGKYAEGEEQVTDGCDLYIREEVYDLKYEDGQFKVVRALRDFPEEPEKYDPSESPYAQYMKYCVEKGERMSVDGFEEWLKTHWEVSAD